MRTGWVGAGLVGLLLLSGCTFSRSDHPDACGAENDCPGGRECIDGFCVVIAQSSRNDDARRDAGGNNPGSDAANSGMDGGGSTRDSGADSGPGEGEPCADGTDPEPCYTGPEETAGVGECRGGQRACVGGLFTQCLGQVVPTTETCNQRDDDCDGTEDEIEDSSCDTQMKGICAEGMLVCKGAFAVCQPLNAPVDEVCNGEDDDCDGSTDEVAATECFPENATGCTQDEHGVWNCVGLCRVGMSGCTSGEATCDDAVTGQTEVCGNSGTPADENCDGNVDENCDCSPTDSRSCYAGPAGTQGKGACRAGTQVCGNDAKWGECMNQVLPQPETCANMNADDNCNEILDDVPGLGDACIDDSQKGICRDGKKECVAGSVVPACVPGKPETERCDDIDQDCDGDPTNGFDLNSDAYCGSCTRSCRTGVTSCCGGECVPVEDFRQDPDNCGECGKRCGSGNYCCWGDCLEAPPKDGEPSILGGQLPPKTICGCTEDCRDGSCCGTACYDLQNDAKHCGSCFNDCTRGTIAQQCCNGRCSAFTCAREL